MNWTLKSKRLFFFSLIRSFSAKAYGPVAGLDNGLPIVALVGRPNVGKSALFNRLIKRKDAMVKNTPDNHVTRDYHCGIARIGDLTFTVIDTSGLEPHMTHESIQKRATNITERLIKRVDLALFMIDAREALTFSDDDVVSWVLASLPKRSKTLLVANKCEALATEGSNLVKKVQDNLADSYRLGLGVPVAISAATGEGMINLCEALLPLISQSNTSQKMDKLDYENLTDESPIKVAIMGLPNVGKSTLLNSLVQHERSLVGPEIGLTRDPVAEILHFEGRKIQLIDTAGWTKFFAYEKMKTLEGKLEKEAYYAARKILKLSHIVVVMIDATAILAYDTSLLRRERQLASEVLNEKRVLMFVLNKIDKLTAEQETQLRTTITEMVNIVSKYSYLAVLHTQIAGRFYEVDKVSCLAISAERGDGVNRLMPEIIQKVDRWSTWIKTSVLNEWFSEMRSLQRLAKFSSGGLRRVKFVSQTKTRPPTFCIRVSGRQPVTYVEKRTFLNALRQSFDFDGVPLRLEVKYNTSWEAAKRMLNLRREHGKRSQAIAAL